MTSSPVYNEPLLTRIIDLADGPIVRSVCAVPRSDDESVDLIVPSCLHDIVFQATVHQWLWTSSLVVPVDIVPFRDPVPERSERSRFTHET